MRLFLYLCSVKRIAYIPPVDYMRGNVSGRQEIEYNGSDAYSIPEGSAVSADNYEPRLVTRVLYLNTPVMVKSFMIRTKTTVNMTARMRMNIALMAGVGAIYAAVVSDKTSIIYNDCVRVCPKNTTLRSFLSPLIRTGLAAKDDKIVISGDIIIFNPWVHEGEEYTVKIPAQIIDKYKDVLALN